jgi:hypothetical protein
MSSSRRRRKGLPPPILPPAVPEQQHRPVSVPYLAGTASETVVDALIEDPESWKRGSGGTLYYGNADGTFVSIGDPAKPAAVNAEEAWRLVIEVGGDEAAQSLLYVMAKCLSSDNPLEKVRISVNDSLGFRGLKRHKNRDFRPEQKRAEARRFRLLSDIWVTAREKMEVPSGRGKRTKSINVTSRLIEVSIESEDDEQATHQGGQPRLPAIVDAQSTDIPFAIRAGLGEWAKPYMETPQFLRHMLHTTIRYDVNKDCERFAMRFSLAIMFNRVGLTTSIGELLQAARISIPKYHLDEFKDNVEEAFELLARDRMTGGWGYGQDYPELPRTRWLQKWLNWAIVFAPVPTALTG